MTDLVADRGQPDEAPPNLIVRLFRHSFVRFVIVGVVCAGVDIAVVLLLTAVGVNDYPAKLAGTLLSFTVNFTLNRVWSFGSAKPAGKQLVYYVILVVANQLYGVFMYPWLHSFGMPVVIADALAIGSASALNYLGYRYWVFRT
jgi:putative flippase GtrA